MDEKWTCKQTESTSQQEKPCFTNVASFQPHKSNNDTKNHFNRLSSVTTLLKVAKIGIMQYT